MRRPAYNGDTMPGSRKIASVIIISVFTALAVSAVCLAAGQPSLMTDCGNQMGSTAICPFMAASVPALADLSVAHYIVIVLTLAIFTAAAAIVVAASAHREPVRLRYGPLRTPISYSNFVLNSISEGTTHARVYDL